jgi:hypothetical protein
MKDDAERRFMYKVDIPVPGTGLGRDLTAMLECCHARVPRLGWEYHGHTTRPSKGAPPQHCARWYFAEAVDRLIRKVVDLALHELRKRRQPLIPGIVICPLEHEFVAL